MLILGLLLIVAGVLAILAALFGTGSTNDSAVILGNDLTTVSIFFLGLGAGVAILWGFSIMRWATRRSLQRRRESKQLSELSEKLERVEAERDSRRTGGARVDGKHADTPADTGTAADTRSDDAKRD